MIGLLVRLVVFVSFLIFAIWIVGGLYLDSIVKKGIEREGPKITGTPVSLDRANFSFVLGRGRLKGLVIGNPKGFHTESAFRLPEIRVTFDPVASALSGKIIINRIVVASPEITHEYSLSGTNLEKIRGNAEAYARRNVLRNSGKASTQNGETHLKRVQIKHVIVTDPKVNVSATLFRGRSLTFELDDIHLRDVGDASRAVTVKEAASLVLEATTEPIFRTVSQSGQVLKKRLKKVDKAVARAGGADEGDSGVWSDISKLAGKAWKAVKDFFGRVKGFFGGYVYIKP